MTFSRSWRLAPESAPTRCDSASRMRSSSSECARSPLVSALTPSTVAERKTSRRRWSAAARRARQWPSAARASTRVARTRTMANSAATKKAFTTTRPRATATSRGSETIRGGREPAAGMLEERCQGRQAPVHDTRTGRVYARPGKAETAAGGGSRMRRGVAVGMGCALVLAGVAAAQARGERELTNDDLRAEMAKNSALAVYVKRNGMPDVAEAHFLADEPPWDDHEVTLYYLDAHKEVGFARAFILGSPEVH